MKKNQCHPHVLVIGTVWPEPQSSAAGSRMMQIIRLFREQDWKVTFASSASESPYSTDLESEGVRTMAVQLNNSSFDVFIHKIHPDIVIFDRFMTEEQFGWRVSEQCPNALRILDTEDLHCLRSARQNALKQDQKFNPRELLNEEVAKRELASIYRCDLSLIISDVEIKLLRSQFNVDESFLHYLPFLLDPVNESTIWDWPSFEERAGFVTIGNFRHPPNWDSVLWLKETIWPLIRKKLPDAELNIYGAYLPQKAQNLHHPETGFMIRGRAENSGEVIGRAKVLLAPLRFGAGLKGKLVEAMQYGTPSVTTDIGAEGIAAKKKWSGFVKNRPEEFADAAVKLYTDSKTWKSAQKTGAELINSRFLKKDFIPVFIERIQTLQANLKEHRRKNFTGAMLMHHTQASSKYMSRWIEEKNK